MNTFFRSVLEKTAILIQDEESEDYHLHYRKNLFDDEKVQPIDCPFDNNCKTCGTWCALFELFNVSEQKDDVHDLQLEAHLLCNGVSSKYSKVFKIKDVLHLATKN